MEQRDAQDHDFIYQEPHGLVPTRIHAQVPTSHHEKRACSGNEPKEERGNIGKHLYHDLQLCWAGLNQKHPLIPLYIRMGPKLGHHELKKFYHLLFFHFFEGVFKSWVGSVNTGQSLEYGTHVFIFSIHFSFRVFSHRHFDCQLQSCLI